MTILNIGDKFFLPPVLIFAPEKNPENLNFDIKMPLTSMSTKNIAIKNIKSEILSTNSKNLINYNTEFLCLYSLNQGIKDV